MPRRNEVFIAGHYYHVFNRGAGQAPIFFLPDNYLYCLTLLKKHSQALKISIIAYCLMPNHYHFLLRPDNEESISRFIYLVFNSYVQAVNRQEGRHGTLFEGRFKHVHVDHDAYLLHVCRYIHANPVQAGIVKTINDWPYSNYLEWVGKRRGTLVDKTFVAEHFKTAEQYTNFVQEYLDGKAEIPKEADQFLF